MSPDTIWVRGAMIGRFILLAAGTAVLFHGPAAAQTREAAQATLARHALAGRIVLSNGANNGAWAMERPVTGLIAGRECVTDFAAPRATRLVNVKDPANHMHVDWTVASGPTIEANAVGFGAPWVGAGNYARLLVADPAARGEIAGAVRVLIQSCNAGRAGGLDRNQLLGEWFVGADRRCMPARGEARWYAFGADGTLRRRRGLGVTEGNWTLRDGELEGHVGGMLMFSGPVRIIDGRIMAIGREPSIAYLCRRASAAAAPAARPVATAPSGPAAMLTRGYAARIPVALGREMQVTGEMVTYHAPSTPFRHHTELALRGKPGDRFILSWRSAVPIEFGYERNRTIDAYPDRAPGDARAFSTTIVFSLDGESRISLVQMGVSETGARRDFVPFFITVQKVN